MPEPQIIVALTREQADFLCTVMRTFKADYEPSHESLAAELLDQIEQSIVQAESDAWAESEATQEDK